VFPGGSGQNDRLIIKPTLLRNVRADITKAASYDAQNEVFEARLTEGTAVAIDWPNEAYITVVGSAINNYGSFKISYFYEDREPDKDVLVGEEEETIDIFTILTFILLGIVAVVILTIIICYFKLAGEQARSKNKIIVDLTTPPHDKGNEMKIIDDY